MTKVLALDPFQQDGIALLRSQPSIELVYLPQPKEDEIAQHMRDAEVLLIRGRVLPAAVFESAERLRLVSRHGVGCDNLDLPLLARRGVTVAVAANANFVSVAEHAFMLMLMGSKSVMRADRAARTGQWAVRDQLSAHDIGQSSILIVGFGRIGQAFARRVAAFEGRMAFYDPFISDVKSAPGNAVRTTDLAASLKKADIVSIHVPLSETTANMFNASMLANCKHGSILVNTSRGGIVDEIAMVAALDAGRPAIYATDVMTDEPPKSDHPLLGRSDVIITPHSAAMTQQAMVRMSIGAAQNVIDYLRDALPSDMIALAPA